MGLFERLSQGLSRTAERLAQGLDAIVGRADEPPAAGGAVAVETAEALEELLLGADLGLAATARILDAVRADQGGGTDLRTRVAEELRAVFARAERPPAAVTTPPRVVLVVGVNGTGKTTTVGKLAHRLREQGHQPLICAADTFRAAAVDQLQIWAQRAGVDIVRAQEGSDAAAVVFDALSAAKARGADPVIVDTAGRLHTRVNLMGELDKIRRIAAREVPGAPHEVLLVLDATVGQNGLAQAREFAAVAGVTGVVLTKLDGTAKGGVAVAIAHDLGLPIRFVGVGESHRRPAAVLRRRLRQRACSGVVVSDLALMRRALFHAAPRCRARPRPTRWSARWWSIATASWSGRAGTSAPAGRTPRCTRWPRPPAAPPAATMYVTLEPCCHVGRTGPCTQRILDAGVTRVVVATLDPFPRVSGRGVEVLRAAGVAVEVGLEGAAARRLNAGFLSAHERRRPFVVVKAAVERRRPHRRRRRRPAPPSRAPRRSAGRSGCGRRSTRLPSAAAPCSPTTRGCRSATSSGAGRGAGWSSIGGCAPRPTARCSPRLADGQVIIVAAGDARIAPRRIASRPSPSGARSIVGGRHARRGLSSAGGLRHPDAARRRRRGPAPQFLGGRPRGPDAPDRGAARGGRRRCAAVWRRGRALGAAGSRCAVGAVRRTTCGSRLMFTGIVEQMGTLAEVKPMAGGYRLRDRDRTGRRSCSPGDSVAVAGVCLTALVAHQTELHADVGPETARVTTLGALARGQRVNLERPLPADGRLGGHFVLGHVDGVGVDRRRARRGRQPLADGELSAVAGARSSSARAASPSTASASPSPASTIATSTCRSFPTPGRTRRSAG